MSLLVFVSYIFLISTKAEAKVLTLKEAVQVGLENSPFINTAKRDSEIAHAEQRSSLARFFPALDLYSSHGLSRNYTAPSSTDPWASDYRLVLTENLYDNGVNINRYKFNSYNAEKMDLEYEKKKNQYVFDVAALYYKFQLQQHILVVRENQNKRIINEYKLADKQYRQGMKSRRDYLRFFSQMQRSEVELEESRRLIRAVKNDLIALLNTDNAIDFAVETGQPLKPPEIPPLDDLKFEQTYDARIQKLGLDAGEMEARLVERRYWPEIFLKSELFYSNKNYLNSAMPYNHERSYGWNALVVLNFNLWDWGTRRRDMEVARQRYMILENETRTSRMKIEAEIKNLVAEIKQLAKTNALNHEIFGAEQQTNKILTTEYQQGRLPYIDLITSINDLRGAEIALVNSHFRLKELIARFHYYQGSVYEKTVGHK